MEISNNSGEGDFDDKSGERSKDHNFLMSEGSFPLL